MKMMTRKTFCHASGAAVAGLALAGAGGCAKKVTTTARVLIVGGGAAGLSVAARLVSRLNGGTITVVDPAERHFYQPGFTFIGSGVWGRDDVWMREADLMPRGVTWVRDAVASIQPAKNTAMTRGGRKLDYDFLVLCPGTQDNWSLVEGITRESLGTGNVHSIYDWEGAVRTWEAIQKFVAEGGRGVYTDTWTKHKCGGAPKKMCLLTEHLARQRGTREKLKLDYFTASKHLYDVPFYTPRLEEIYRERQVSLRLNAKLTGVDTAAKKAHFEDRVTGETWREDYDFLHFVPPQSAPDFVREAGLGWTEGKLAKEAWAMVDKATLVHLTYKNVIALGDVAGIPTSKTSAAIRKQAPIAVENLVSLIAGEAPTARYDGYAACPIITDYGHVLMAEFDYEKKPATSFPLNLLDTSKELRSGWWLKKYVLKPMYFRLMLKGLA